MPAKSLLIIALCGFATLPAAVGQPRADLSSFTNEHGQPQPVKTVDDWLKRRGQILDGFMKAAGTMPIIDTIPAHDPQVTEEKTIGTVRRVTMTIVGRDGVRFPVDLYLPAKVAGAVTAASGESKSGDTTSVAELARVPTSTDGGRKSGDFRYEGSERVAAVIALHPTGPPGKRIVAGEGGKLGRQYGLELAQRGYVVVAPDYPSFGDSPDYDFANDAYSSGTMKGIVNHMSCVDFLQSLPFVTPDNIGVIGHSLGGHNAIFLGVFDERVKVIVSCCGWTPFHDYYGGDIKGWTSDRYMPALRDTYELNPDKVPFDFYELIAALAPRTFVSVSPTRDENFDVAGVRKAIPVARSIYSLHGVADEIVLMTPDCEHDFPMDSRMQSYQIMDRVLKHTPDPFEPDYSEELPRIAPTEPDQALKTFETVEGFAMQLTASEPLIADPVAMSFDADGKLYVVEMSDYSEQDTERLGRVRLLEDTDDDGRFDRSDVFADGLSWPTAITCSLDGVFVGAAPDVIFLKDIDGDRKADEREVVFTGFNRGNVQGLINSFHWGSDNRIYGSASTSGGIVTSPKHPDRAAVDLRGRDFSFDPRTLELRAETGGGQHGMCFDDWGHRFVSSNSDHAQAIIYDDRYLLRGPVPNPAPPRVSIAVDGGQAPVFRISPVEPWRIVRTRLRTSGLSQGIVEGGGRAAGYFTGATGITIYRGDAWPEDLKGIAIVGDVGSNIIHRKRLTPDGVSWKAERMDEGREFVASTDIWFRPVQFANAPDGCLHVLDMYREVIEHPASLPPEIKRHLDLTSGRDRGRLYRIAPTGFVPRPSPKLAAASTAELVALLEHKNGWHRDTASRLLFERQDISSVPSLRALLSLSSSPSARFHSIGSLEGLSYLNEHDVIESLTDAEPCVVERALRAAERLATFETVAHQVSKLVDHTDFRVRMQLGFSLGEFASAPDRSKLLARMLERVDDIWTRTAVLSSIRSDAKVVLVEHSISLLELDPAGTPLKSTTLPDIAAIAALQANGDEDWDSITDALGNVVDGRTLTNALLAMQKAYPNSSSIPAVRQLIESHLTELRSFLSGPPSAWFETATLDELDNVIASSIPKFALSTFEVDGPRLLEFLAPTNSPRIQTAAMTVLLGFTDDRVAPAVTERWHDLSPALSTQAHDALLSRPTWAVALLDAAEAGSVPANTITTADLQRLLSQPDVAVKSRAEALLAKLGPSPREDVLRSYQSVLALNGDIERGAAVFKQHCAVCHRVGDVGHEVGPKLATLKTRGPEFILTNVLDPNREVNPAWRDYIATTTDGVSHNGVVISETAVSITLRRSEAKETALARSEIYTLSDTGRSLMPEGLEKSITQQSMADLIAWIMQLE